MEKDLGMDWEMDYIIQEMEYLLLVMEMDYILRAPECALQATKHSLQAMECAPPGTGPAIPGVECALKATRMDSGHRAKSMDTRDSREIRLGSIDRATRLGNDLLAL